MLARHALKKAGIVAGGEGILLAANVRYGARERVAGILRGPLEHQMLKEMRETGFAGCLVGGPDLVPDHVRDDRSTMVRHDDNFEPVRQCEVRNLRLSAGARRSSATQSAD